MRWLLQGLAIYLILACSLCEAQTKSKTKAKDPKRPYDVGQIIEVNEFSQWIPAKVDGYGLTGIDVILEPEGKFKDAQERLRKRTYSLSQTRAIKGQKSDSGKGDDDGDDDGDDPPEKSSGSKTKKSTNEKKGGSNSSTGAKKGSGTKSGNKSTKITGKAKGELLDWTDDTGKHTITARFIKLVGEKVTLEKRDGKIVTIDMHKLDGFSQVKARQLSLAAMMRGDDDDNPFKDEDFGIGGFDEEGEGIGEARAVRANWGEAFALRVDLPESGNYPLDPARADGGQATKKSIALHANTSNDAFFEGVEGIALNPDTLKGAMFMVDDNPSRNSVAGVQPFDLKTGKAGPLAPISVSVKPKDVSPSGELVVATSDFLLRRGQGPREGYVTILKWKGKELSPWKTWFSFEPTDFHKADPSAAMFVDEDHVITVSFPSNMVLWNIPKMKALYHTTLEGGGSPALSPGRKHIACPSSQGICIYDVLTGNGIIRLPGGNPGHVQAMGFHPNGKRFAALTSQRLMVWDLEKLEMERDVYLSKAVSGKSLDWVGDNYVLCGGKDLIDLNLRVVLWQYSNGEHGGVVGSDYWYLLTATDRSARAIFPAIIPHPSVKKVADSLKPEDLLAIRPGATIAIRWAVQGNQNEVNGAYQSLVKQLQDIGMTYAEKSRLVLDVSTAVGKTHEINYRSFGRFGGGETVRTTDQISIVRFVEDKTIIWEAQAHMGAPHFLSLKQNETVQQALAKYQQPNIEFFKQVKLPPYVARPHPSGAYGHSQLTTRGIVDSK